MKLVFTPEAERQAAEMDSWWRKHRPAARDLFARELGEAGELIARTPSAGVVYTSTRGQLFRRVLIAEDQEPPLLRGRRGARPGHRPRDLGCAARAWAEAVVLASSGHDEVPIMSLKTIEAEPAGHGHVRNHWPMVTLRHRHQVHSLGTRARCRSAARKGSPRSE